MSIFLTEAELAELTGYKLARKQIDWLDAKGWAYAESRYGRPKVLRSYMEQRLGNNAAVDDGRRTEPDFSHWS